MSSCFASLSVGFLTPHNPFNRLAFSGTPFFAARALGRHPRLRCHILGAHQPPARLDRLLKRRGSTLDKNSQINVSGLDAVVGLVASPLLDALASRHPNMPYLHVTDATPAFLRDVYGWAVPKTADACEARVVSQAAQTVYSSEIMAARAAANLGLATPRVTSVPFGINLETSPGRCPEKPPLTPLNLLFVGLDWVRKGGDIAVATLNELRCMGYNARLTIVGRKPQMDLSHPAIEFVGFLDKNKPAQAAKLAKLYTQSHVMLLPSRGDCTPMVVGEAMAHGTPVLATDTGGVSTLLGDTGILMAPFTSPHGWALAVLALCDDDYALQSRDSYERAHQVLTWDHWADRIADILHTQVKQAEDETRNAA